jgi:Tfp pilus assembly protein PilN
LKKEIPIGFLLIVLVLVVAGGTAVASQWKQTLLLRGDLAHLQAQAAELKRLQAENERLKGQQIPAAELERLRADHNAVVRLRAELETLQKSTPPKR